MMNRMSNVNNISYNALTTKETCEILEVSRQMVNKYVKDKRLPYIKKTQNGYLFYRPDVVTLKYEINDELDKLMPFEHRNVISDESGITSHCSKFVEENINRLSEINRVYIFFNDIDPIIEGYYKAEELSLDNDQMFRVTNPTMVIKDVDNNEMWLNGFNCGYGGTGPNGSLRFLKELGVPEEIANEVFIYRVVKYQKSDGEWSLMNSRDSVVPKEWDCRYDNNLKADIQYYNGRLILIQNECSFRKNPNVLGIIEKYRAFIPEPVEILLYKSKDEAKDKGFFIKNSYSCRTDNVYQVIIRDRSGRELWLSTDIYEDDDLSERKDLNSIIESCGFKYEFEKNEKGLSDIVKSWFTVGGKQVEPQVIVIN